MNRNCLKTRAILVLLLVLTIACKNNEKSPLTLFSEQIPEDTPLVFAQDVISTGDKEFAITFSPDMEELYFTRRKPEERNKVLTMKLVNGKWSTPEPAFFASDKGWDFEPHINPKGDKLFFGSTRPLNDTLESSGMHQWVSERTENGWAEPTPLNKPFVDRFAMYVSSSDDDNIYFTSREPEDERGDGGIYVANIQNGYYQNVQRMGKEINFNGQWIAHPYIAPDESYLIYDGESPNGYGDCDLYISFNIDGTWTESVNLGPKINTDQCEMCPSVSPDGKFLFFQRGNGDLGNIYWVDFNKIKEEVINNLQNK